MFYYYGNVRLDKDGNVKLQFYDANDFMMIFIGEKLQFDDADYLMMTFTAGIAVGLFFYSASEPMWHYIGSNRYAKSGHTNDMATGRVSSLSSARRIRRSSRPIVLPRIQILGNWFWSIYPLGYYYDDIPEDIGRTRSMPVPS